MQAMSFSNLLRGGGEAGEVMRDAVKKMALGPAGVAASAMSVEAKKKLLWGKKAEPEVAKVKNSYLHMHC